MLEGIWSFLSSTGQVWYPLLLSLTAFIETLFPPFPGDVVYVALTGLGWTSGMQWWLLWLSGLAGCLVSTVILDRIGRSDGLEKLEIMVIGSSGRNGFERARRIIAARGVWILIASRFIPGIRSLLVIAASSSGISRRKVLLCAGFSAALWYGILAVAGHFAGSTLDGAEGFMNGFSRMLWIVLAVTVAAGAVVMLFRIRRADR